MPQLAATLFMEHGEPASIAAATVAAAKVVVAAVVAVAVAAVAVAAFCLFTRRLCKQKRNPTRNQTRTPPPCRTRCRCTVINGKGSVV